MKWYILTFISIIFIFTFSCSKIEKQEDSLAQEKILAKIASKDISVGEFIRRAEYTIRPRYCKGSTGLEKKIILNSLIAEKMFALEAGDTASILKKEVLQNYLIGRKEQAMRQWLFYNEAYKKAIIPDSITKKYYNFSGRKYKIKYITIQNDSAAQEIAHLLYEQKVPLENIYKKLAHSDSIPQREIDFFKEPNETIIKTFFSTDHQRGELLPVMHLDKNYNIFAKIVGWTEQVAVTEKQKSQRWNDVKSKLKEYKASEIYSNLVSSIMADKEMRLVDDAFFKVVEILKPIYLVPEKEQKDAFLKIIFKKEQDSTIAVNYFNEKEKIKNMPFLEIDGKIWTVERFFNELEKHPLVFRKRRMSPAEFPLQLKLAIADLVRDRYITEYAYKKGYDKIPVVQRNYNMWKDAITAKYFVTEYLKNQNIPDSLSDLEVIDKYLNPLVDSLQKKYSKNIFIDTEAFNKIKLSRIDLFVYQKNVPFTIVVPSFPKYTTDPWLNYGNKLNK